MNPTSAEPAIAESPPAAPIDGVVSGVCPVCRAGAAEQFVECPSCHVRHHEDCWEYNGGCGSYGCKSAPATEKLTEMEIPPSFWGNSQKTCPSCQNLIQAAAMRCRFCGTVFSTVRPQDAGEFQQNRALAESLPRLRRQSIALMVFCVIPFTAALAAIVGGIWYASNRQRIASLPASQAALPKIALGVAIGQTIVLAVVLALYRLMGP